MEVVRFDKDLEDSYRRELELYLWPLGPTCPNCGNKEHRFIGTVKKNQDARVRSGLYQCNRCEPRRQFTVTTGTILSRTHLKMSVWYRLIMDEVRGVKRSSRSYHLARMGTKGAIIRARRLIKGTVLMQCQGGLGYKIVLPTPNV